MRESALRRWNLRWPVLVVLLCASIATPAFAHKLSVFAAAEGRTIRGRAYLHGGAAVRRAAVSVFDAQGEKLGETTTDDQGLFRLEARFRCDHRIVADSGDGHRAEYTVRAAALPADLPARGENVAIAIEKGDGALPVPAGKPGRGPTPDDRSSLQLADLARQIEQLQFQIDEQGNRSRLQDILGGIGYIFGVMGLAFYFLGVRRKERPGGSKDA